jgi:pteridine reductase
MSNSPRVALITGSGKRRIGAFLADALAARGYALAIHYRTSAEEARLAVAAYEQQGVEAIALQADLTDEAAVQELVAAVLARFGRIDVLANCVSIWSPKPFEQVTAADLRANFDANTLSTFLCSQQAGLAMVRQPEGGCIVNFGDWAVARPYPNYAAYFASKGAISTLTRCLAVELGTRNPRVRVNCIEPGPVMLPPDLPAAEREQAISATLVQREGSPMHVVQAALCCIENEFMTGACIPVDGGRTIYARGF